MKLSHGGMFVSGVLSIAVYALFIALILFGGKFAGRDGFFEEPFEKDALIPLRGVAAVGVIFHHISQEDAFEDLTRELWCFRKVGFLLVAVFMFSSGYGLIKSLKRKPGYMDTFAQRRFPEILVPFYMNVLIYGIIMPHYVGNYAPLQWVTNSLGLTMMNEYGWFTVAFFLLYVAFYFIFRKVKDIDKGILYMLFVVLFMGVIFCVGGHFPWWTGEAGWWLESGAFSSAPWWKQIYVHWFGGEWWVNSVIGFVVGMVYGQYDAEIINWFKKKYWVKLAGSVAFFAFTYWLFRVVDLNPGYWSEFKKPTPGIGDKFLCYFVQLFTTSSFVVMIATLLMKFKTSNLISRFFGKISFETFLMNYVVIYMFRFLTFKKVDGAWQAVAYGPCNMNLILFTLGVFAVTTAFGFIVHYADQFLIKFFQKLGMKKKSAG